MLYGFSGTFFCCGERRCLAPPECLHTVQEAAPSFSIKTVGLSSSCALPRQRNPGLRHNPQSSALHLPDPHTPRCSPGSSAALPSSGSISLLFQWPDLPEARPVRALGSDAGTCGDPGHCCQPRPWSQGFPALRQAAAPALHRQHCFFLCLLVSNGNCTTESQYVWNLAWGCFGYIEVFASALPDLNGDFTSTELKRRKGEEGGSAASGSEGEGQGITSSLGRESNGKDMTHSG